jgi:membrane-bound lytic murein transglycosylase F
MLCSSLVGALVLSGCTEQEKDLLRSDKRREKEIVTSREEKEKEIPSQFKKQGKDGLRRIEEKARITLITKNNGHCFYTYGGESMGFEHDLAKAFADHLGVNLRVRTPRAREMVEALNMGEGDFIAANMTVTPSRKEHVDFSDEYLSVQQRVVLHRNNYTVRRLEDLNGKTIHVRKGTPYEERLYELRDQGIDFTLRRHYDTPVEELIRRVATKRIEITIADSNIALLNRRYYPDIRIGCPVEDPQSVAWAVRKGERALLAEINSFFDVIRANGTFQRIYETYYRNVEIFDRFDVKKFHERIRTRLPKYEAIIRRAADKYGFDWRLIAAVVYQESHFDPNARSHRGAKGLMQLTKTTAEEMSVTDRLDPEQSIMGGVKYLNKLYGRYKTAEGSDRLLITLASYNVGPRQISNAQSIAQRKGLNPYEWSSLEEALPLLCRERYVRRGKLGDCRGNEPVRYVNRILLYFDILRKQGVTQTASIKRTPERGEALQASF